MEVASDAGGHRQRLDVEVGLAALQEVREAVHDVTTAWRTTVDRDRLDLLVTELVTNAVRHGAPPVTVSVAWDGERLRCEVVDAAAAEPVLRDPAPEDPGGRGLWLVDRMAVAWGVHQRDGGKGVWFELPAGPA
jgi:anti-sigma regulatory factor (Ser/Thr protein kinase)